MPAPDIIHTLVERFHEQREAYQSGKYNETQLRREFLDPFFKALGWDVDNEKGWAEAYKDVVHEDSIKVGGLTKAPDYAFRIGGARKFFVEAKKPSVNIKGDVGPAFQLRRYAWSAKLPLSILTDFEEFAVYDSRVRPDRKDKASTARLMFLRFDEYEEKWADIATIFSREAVLKGSFDKFAEGRKKRRGTAEVDEAFLKEIEDWRDALARNVALRNESLSQRDLNFAVQRIIDRIVFLRISEDRGIEDYGRLQALVNGENTYRRLTQLFQEADARYNSGLFHFNREEGREEAPDDLTPDLAIDDKVLKDILRHLYYPDSPYEFSVLPADILGQVYERFLGKVIRLTPGHRAVVEDKPEVKKAGGVYYTPTYIVDFIIDHTVGQLLKDRTPRQVNELRVVDPACGSGSFLIGAYQRLLDWHLHWYEKQGSAKDRRARTFEGPAGDLRLTTAERKRILLNNIYGVDIDQQAVEVTKLSLLLKVLEGETSETLQTVLRLSSERALPDLGKNIKCGNSLIAPSDLQSHQLGLLDDDDLLATNPFDWQAEFPSAFDRRPSGFDAVIGNPPYVLLPVSRDMDRTLLASKFALSGGKPDLFRYFIEATLPLVRPGRGLHGFIVPSSILTIPAASELRAKMVKDWGLTQVVVFEGAVFDVSVNSTIIISDLGSPDTAPVAYHRVENRNPSALTVSLALEDPPTELPRDQIINTEGCSIQPWDRPVSEVITRIQAACTPLKDLAEYTLGMQTYHNSIHTKEQIKERVYHSKQRKNSTFHPESGGRNVKRYQFVEDFREFVSYGDWCYNRPDWRFCEGERIVLREITSETLVAAVTTSTHVPSKAVMIIRPESVDVWTLLAILNSRALGRIVALTTEKGTQRLFPRISLTSLRSLPIPTVASPEAEELAVLARRATDLAIRSATTHDESKQRVVRATFDQVDKEIEMLVCDAYGLTASELSALSIV